MPSLVTHICSVSTHKMGMYPLYCTYNMLWAVNICAMWLMISGVKATFIIYTCFVWKLVVGGLMCLLM